MAWYRLQISKDWNIYKISLKLTRASQSLHRPILAIRWSVTYYFEAAKGRKPAKALAADQTRNA